MEGTPLPTVHQGVKAQMNEPTLITTHARVPRGLPWASWFQRRCRSKLRRFSFLEVDYAGCCELKHGHSGPHALDYLGTTVTWRDARET